MAPRVIKKVELIFVLGIVVLFVLVIGKYINTHLVEKKIGAFEHSVKKILPAGQAETASEPRHSSLDLIFEGSTWVLRGAGSERFGLETDKSGKLTLVKKNQKQTSERSSFSAQIDGVDTYYSLGQKLQTDIPADPRNQKIVIHEQEDFLPILGYHHILPDEQEIKNPQLEVHVSKFEKQVAYLTNVMGCRWFTFGDIMENYVLKGEKVPKRACVMNFDDGRKNHFTQGYKTFKKYGAVATFYIIAKRALDDHPEYINISELDELYKNGNEIGSHTVDAGGLLSERYNHKGLVYQLEKSKEMLEEKGFTITTVAYPRGEQNEEVVDIASKLYVAGRDTQKDNPWREKRPATVSFDEDFIWHMNYYKPELKEPEEIGEELGYNTWWQFEEGYRVDRNTLGNLKTVSSYRPTDTSYAAVSLTDIGDKVSNKFLVSSHDTYTIDFYGTVNTYDNIPSYAFLDTVNVYVDGVKQKLVRNWNPQDCVLHQKQYYCYYSFSLPLAKGEHVLSLEAKTKFVKLDKFRVNREIQKKDIYHVSILEQ